MRSARLLYRLSPQLLHITRMGRRGSTSGALITVIIMVGTLTISIIASCRDQERRPKQLTVSGVYIAGPAGASPAALYATITNNTDAVDSLVAIATPIAEHADLHEEMHHGAGISSMTMMTPVAAIRIPHDSTVRLAPDGYHGMLVGLRRSIAPGDTVAVEFRFRRAGVVPTRARVVSYAELARVLGDGTVSGVTGR